MGIFSYSAKTKKGKIVKGSLEAESKDKALEYLHSQGSIILFLKQGKVRKTARVKGKVKVDDLVIFSRQLTTLIESGIPLVGALDILQQQVEKPVFKEVINITLKDLREGSSLAGALAKHPKVFPEIYVSMVEAAETSGNLPQILDRLSLYLEKMSALRRKIIASMIYPAIVVIMTTLMSSFLIFKIIPTFKQLYESIGAKLPLPTLILINFADMVKNNILFIIILFVVGIICFKKYISTPSGKRKYHKVLLKLPIFGKIVVKVGIAKFARTFATLVKSSVPITTSLEIVGKTSGNKIIEEAVIKAKKSIQEGIPVSIPLEESGVFPPMVIKMIAVGEKTGKLEHMLSKIAQFYEEQTDAAISGLTSLIEPLLIVFLGIVVGAIVISLFLPIIEISQLIAKS